MDSNEKSINALRNALEKLGKKRVQDIIRAVVLDAPEGPSVEMYLSSFENEFHGLSPKFEGLIIPNLLENIQPTSTMFDISILSYGNSEWFESPPENSNTKNNSTTVCPNSGFLFRFAL